MTVVSFILSVVAVLVAGYSAWSARRSALAAERSASAEERSADSADEQRKDLVRKRGQELEAHARLLTCTLVPHELPTAMEWEVRVTNGSDLPFLDVVFELLRDGEVVASQEFGTIARRAGRGATVSEPYTLDPSLVWETSTWILHYTDTKGHEWEQHGNGELERSATSDAPAD